MKIHATTNILREFSTTPLTENIRDGDTVIKPEKIDEFLTEYVLPETFKDTINQQFIPLAELLEQNLKSHSGTYYLGINGCQGSGKSTLSEFLAWYMTDKSIKVAVLSLDDFYHDRETRQSMANDISPLLATRGVPGTHDTSLMSTTLASLAEKQEVTIPRFNKAQDNPFPKSQWSRVAAPVELVIMEGWCWGVQPQTPLQLRYPVNALEAEKDPNLTWRKWVNQQLTEYYTPLYQQMNFWVMLRAPGFDTVFKWRLEQEQKLAVKVGNTASTKVMSESDILDFIQFYQRLTEECLSSLPERCNVVFELDENRHIFTRTGF